MSRVLLMTHPFTVPADRRGAEFLYPPLGLAYIAAVLEAHGHAVKILDVLAEGVNTEIRYNDSLKTIGMTYGDVFESIRIFAPDFVGISCMYSIYAEDAFMMAGIVKELNPEIKVVMGGAHVTMTGDTSADVDHVVRGPGENPMLDIVSGAKSKEITGVSYDNQDDFPFPARHLLPTAIYNQAQSDNKNYQMRVPAAQMITSRGCPGHCCYCAVAKIWGRKWQARSAVNVVDEIAQLVAQGYGEISFMDDSMGVDRKRLQDICLEIMKRGLDVKWTTPNGIAVWTLDRETISMMKAAGCYRLTFGLESGSQRIRDFIGKSYDPDRARDTIKFCSRIGLYTLGTFILGFPDETETEMQETLRFALSTELDFAVFYAATPFRGTRLYDSFLGAGITPPDTCSQFAGGCDTRFFSGKEINAKREAAYRSFLKSRLRRPWRFLRKIRSAEDAVYFLKLCRNFAGPLLASKLNPGSFWR